jgi:hypothetical protein
MAIFHFEQSKDKSRGYKMADAPTEITTEIDAISKQIDDTINRLNKSAEAKERRSSREWVWDVILRATTAILAVASPALVTYSTTANVGQEYKLAAILLTGIAGASTTLQSIFALQQSYVHDAVDALDLYNVSAQLESGKQEALGQGSSGNRYAGLKKALSEAIAKYREITVGRQKGYLVGSGELKG